MSLRISSRDFWSFARYPGTWLAGLIVAGWAGWTLLRLELTSELIAFVGLLSLLAIAAWFAILAAHSLLTRGLSEAEARERRLAREQELGEAFRALQFVRGAEQLASLRIALEGLTTVVASRFLPNELTFTRYMRSATSVFDATIQNLEEILLALRSVSAVSSGEEDARRQSPCADRDRCSTTQHDRMELRREQGARIQQLLQTNEAALTAMTRTATALASNPTGARGMRLDADAAIEELERLAARTPAYAARVTTD